MTRPSALVVVLALLVTVPSLARADGDERVLPPSVGATFQTLLDEVNRAHELGAAVTITDIRVDGAQATISLVEATHSARADVILTWSAPNRGPWSHWFAYRVDPTPPPEELAPAVARLGPLLDATFPGDPWALAVTLPPPPRTPGHAVWDGHGYDSFKVRSRGRVLGGAVIVALLSLLALAGLSASERRE